MNFEADLDIIVDGTTAHVRGDGAALIIESTDPARLVGSLRRAAGPRARRHLTLVADGLAATGASVHVEGPRGRFATVGADADSPALGVLSGTRHLAVGWRAVASPLASALKNRRAVIVVAGVAIAAIVAVRAT